VPTIHFPCPHCGQGQLEARLGTAEQFGPPTVDSPTQWAEITRRRQEYIGAQVMRAIVTHCLYGECTALDLEECAAIQPVHGHKCTRALHHEGDHEVQTVHPVGVITIARWPALHAVPRPPDSVVPHTADLAEELDRPPATDHPAPTTLENRPPA
jgi:hypothetical protein